MYHPTAWPVTYRAALAGMGNGSMGAPRGTAAMSHCTMSGSSPWSSISPRAEKHGKYTPS